MSTKHKTLDTILAQIAKLEAEADEFRTRERDGVIERIRTAMVTYRITAKELAGPKPGALGESPPAAKPTKSELMRGRVKYAMMDPAGAGDLTWSGYGRMPRWVREYLEANKKHKLEDLLVMKS